MPRKIRGKKVYKTMQGKVIDMELLRQKNELIPAVGNVRVNARGDELGPGGKIVKTREQILKEYYENSEGAPDEIPLKRSATPAPVTTTETVVQEEEWTEDEEGNFVQKKNTRSKK